MTSAQIIIVVTIVAYLFAMLLIGVIFNRAGAADTSDGFYIGGRSLGPPDLPISPVWRKSAGQRSAWQ